MVRFLVKYGDPLGALQLCQTYVTLEICRREHLEFRKEEEAKSILTMVDL